MRQRDKGDLVALDNRELRNVGNCVGFSLNRKALRQLGYIDDDGSVNNSNVRIELYDDGTIVAKID